MRALNQNRNKYKKKCITKIRFTRSALFDKHNQQLWICFSFSHRPKCNKINWNRDNVGQRMRWRRRWRDGKSVHGNGGELGEAHKWIICECARVDARIQSSQKECNEKEDTWTRVIQSVYKYTSIRIQLSTVGAATISDAIIFCTKNRQKTSIRRRNQFFRSIDRYNIDA